MRHIDLFTGIGGFSLACEWNGIETILFCDNNKFCQKVLKKHWPDVPIVEDVNDIEKIKQIIADTEFQRLPYGEYQYRARPEKGLSQRGYGLLLTAGFPCQPFSNAGRKRGANDDRYLWPQTFAVIEAIKPDWIILENVAGLLGMVFPDNEIEMANQASLFGNEDEAITDYNTITGRIDADLKQAGYETVWLVIPACSLSAPHRRDRVWIVADTTKSRTGEQIREIGNKGGGTRKDRGKSLRQGNWQVGTGGLNTTDKYDNVTNTQSRESWQQTEQEGRQDISGGNISTPNASQQGLQGQQPGQPVRLPGQCDREWGYEKPGWTENWYEVATRFCRVDDGIPNRVDRLKSLGNAIVPQVAYEIIKAIKEANK